MGILDYMKTAAMNFISPPKKPMKNLEKPDYPQSNPYKDLNQDGPDPILKPRKSGVNLFNPVKDTKKDISRNKYGHYVSTMTYPLPPVSWEKKQFEKNRRMRNGKNNYL